MTQDKFMSQVDKMRDGCWLWRGRIQQIWGYGYLGKGSRAHRVSYQLFKGVIPKGMHVLHSCDVRHCVNPDHLRIGTHAENMRDKMSKGRHRQVNPYTYKPRPTHCKRGHEWNEESTYIHQKRGRRQCKLCMKLNNRRRIIPSS